MADVGAFLHKETAGLPNWAWLAVIAAGIGAAFLLPKYFHTGSSQSDTSGLAIDPTTGLPYAPGLPAGGVVGTTGPGSTSPGQQAQVRQSGIYPTWDASHTGVPVRTSPGGTVIGTLPFGSSLQLLGSVQGPSNTGATSGAPYSTTWYSISFNGQTAYISAADVIFGMLSNIISPGIQAGAMPSRAVQQTAWPGGTSQVRMVG